MAGRRKAITSALTDGGRHRGGRVRQVATPHPRLEDSSRPLPVGTGRGGACRAAPKPCGPESVEDGPAAPPRPVPTGRGRRWALTAAGEGASLLLLPKHQIDDPAPAAARLIASLRERQNNREKNYGPTIDIQDDGQTPSAVKRVFLNQVVIPRVVADADRVTDWKVGSPGEGRST